VAGKTNTSIPTPAKSLGGRFGAGDPQVASPETQPLETAMRDFPRTATFKKAYDKSRKTGGTGLS